MKAKRLMSKIANSKLLLPIYWIGGFGTAILANKYIPIELMPAIASVLMSIMIYSLTYLGVTIAEDSLGIPKVPVVLKFFMSLAAGITVFNYLFSSI